MSTRDYEIVIRKDSTIPAERARALKRMRVMLAPFHNGVLGRAADFFHGLTLGWVVSDVSGQADADEIRELLPERCRDVFDAIPYGPDNVAHPEFESLTDKNIPEGLWFDFWMGIKKSLYDLTQQGDSMPQRSVFAWLGFLRGELEGGGISPAEYDKLCALLPQVHDDLTPLVAATH